MVSKLFMPFMQDIYYDDNDSEGMRLWKETLKALQNVMERMAPSLSGVDYTYAQWKSVAQKGQYSFFIAWLEREGEQYLSKICSTNLDDSTSDRLLDQFDEAVFELQMASEVDDVEVLAADIADVLVALSRAVEQYGHHDENVYVYDEDIVVDSTESSFECESSPSGCEDFFISIAA